MLKGDDEGPIRSNSDRHKNSTADNGRFNRQIEFILEMDKLKSVSRRTTLLDSSRQENSAEHSWHIALSVLVLSEYAQEKNLNTLQVIKLLLAHDLVEIDAGDTYAYDQIGIRDQHTREMEAADRIFNILPSDQADMLRALWDEYEARDTPESRFANALDRVQPFLHNYFTRGHTWQKHGVRKQQVIIRMLPVKDGSPFLWDYIARLIDDAVDKGYLAE